MASVDTEVLKDIIKAMEIDLFNGQDVNETIHDLRYEIHKAEAKEEADAQDEAEFYGQGKDMNKQDKKNLEDMKNDVKSGVEMINAIAPEVLKGVDTLKPHLAALVSAFGEALYGSSLKDLIDTAFKVELMKAVLRSGGTVNTAKLAVQAYDDVIK